MGTSLSETNLLIEVINLYKLENFNSWQCPGSNRTDTPPVFLSYFLRLQRHKYSIPISRTLLLLDCLFQFPGAHDVTRNVDSQQSYRLEFCAMPVFSSKASADIPDHADVQATTFESSRKASR
jgi:hypothetical protein